MNKLTAVMIFVLGVLTGSLITCTYAKNKYEQIADEEIQSVKEAFKRRTRKEPPKKEEKEAPKESETLKQKYGKQMENLGYADYYISPEKDEKPYVISPEEFGEMDSYDTISLTYYDDDILTDDHDEVIENRDELVGRNFTEHFGEYEDDCVFIRNDEMKADYEILMEHRRYGDDE